MMRQEIQQVSSPCDHCPNKFARDATRGGLEKAEARVQEIEQQLASLRGLGRAVAQKRTRLKEDLAYQQAVIRVATRRFTPRELTPTDIDTCEGAYTRVQPFVLTNEMGVDEADPEHVWIENACGAGLQHDRSPIQWGSVSPISE